MPMTVNGIGTTYYGKKNFKAYEGQCSNCRRVVQLQEYETRLWFVVVFVPVIPLGRKQILDYCPVCQRHRVIPVAEWERIKEQAIDEATKSFSQHADDPQAAIELLQTLSSFSRFDEAERLAQGIEQRFDDDADVQQQMGLWHDFRDRPESAQRCYHRALELDPNHTGAKRGVALAMINAGQLPAVRNLLTVEPVIGPSDDPGLYMALGQAHQQRNEHSEALEVFEGVLAAAPKLHKDEAVRKLVRKSEKQMPERAPVLARKPLYRQPAVVVSAMVVVAAAAFFGSNFYIARHRTLHVLNGFGRPLAVQLDDRAPITLAPNSHQVQTLAEGPHRALVTLGGKELDRGEFEIRSGFWARFFDSPVYILNAGRGALVGWEQTTYAVRPINRGTGRLAAGRRYLAFDDVDYAFVEFPDTLDLPNGKPLTKTRVDILPADAAQILPLDEATISNDDKLAFAEAHLEVTPQDKTLLDAYLNAAFGAGQLDRAKAFVAAGLDKRPIRVEWHRMAANLSKSEQQEEDLRQRYAKMLEKEPNSSAALYLAGRLAPRRADRMSYFDRAIAADPDNPYPWRAKGYEHSMLGEFGAAKSAYQKAVGLDGTDEEVRKVLWDVQLGLGEYAQLEAEVRKALAETPLDIGLHLRLLELLVAQGKLGDASRAHQKYVTAFKVHPEGGEGADMAQKIGWMKLHYLEPNYRRLLADAQDPTLAQLAAGLRFVAHLETGNFAEAAADLESDPNGTDAFDELYLSIGWRLFGDSAKADEWQEKARRRLAEGLVYEQNIASLLEHPTNVSWDEIDELQTDFGQKAAVLVALAQQSPDKREKLLALAEKLNCERKFPYHFLNRVIEKMRQTE